MHLASAGMTAKEVKIIAEWISSTGKTLPLRIASPPELPNVLFPVKRVKLQSGCLHLQEAFHKDVLYQPVINSSSQVALKHNEFAGWRQETT